MNMPVKLSCRGLWKVFGPRPHAFLERHDHRPAEADFAASHHVGAVRDVSFDVHEGEILVIMGLSGSGKSTLIRCLTRLIEPTAGRMEFENRDLLKLSRVEHLRLRRDKLGMVFQHFGLLPHRTALDNVAFPLEVKGVDKEARRAIARRYLSIVGLDGKEAFYPRELSGGQKQRVGIARSLTTDPEIWFLDEPFSALDPLIRRDLQDEFLKLQKQLHKTIIFITHDFSEALRVADRIAIMKDGRIIQLDTPENIVLRPADGYVARFGADTPKDSVLSAGAIADTALPERLPPRRVYDHQKLSDIAPDMLLDGEDRLVLDAADLPAGILTRRHLVSAVFGGRTS
ncbi:quaternary amine ABC transporter ATP-binding protein [Salipiger abyssi]|uniref:Glycine betaine/proline transport system ATP-binding protein n=1 Tax=Salipiger abyssi TaxID=1250539 RepID=A0A1P8UN12_9RHOB|nr:ATP-binding cassette domain-containing protein [Salipiger abyssi]APZ50762.1 glycine betaine/proline transport system ATP-binding protein [Salipiger abyssi]